MGKTFVYVGSWRANDQPTYGITIYQYEPENGQMTRLKTVYKEYCIGAIWLDKSRDILYAADERVDLPGMRKGGGGRIIAFSVNPRTGDLEEISRQFSYGANPVSLVTDSESKFLLVANHGARNTVTQTVTNKYGKISIQTLHDESNVVLFPLKSSGSIDEPCDLFRLSGEGPEIFQLGPHAHSIRRSPFGNLYAVCDKGGDQIYMLQVDYCRNKLVLCEESPIHRSMGSAPRYSVFHPTKPYVYVNKENRTLISAFRYNMRGKLEHICTVNSLPENVAPPKGFCQSNLVMDAKGRFLYTLVRIVNMIVVHAVDEETGELKRIQVVENVPEGGRACAISPDGHFLVTAAISGIVTSYPIHTDGTLGQAVSVQEQAIAGAIAFYEGK